MIATRRSGIGMHRLIKSRLPKMRHFPVRILANDAKLRAYSLAT